MKTSEILIFSAPLLIIAMLLGIFMSPTGTGTTASTHAPEYKAPTTLKPNKQDY